MSSALDARGTAAEDDEAGSAGDEDEDEDVSASFASRRRSSAAVPMMSQFACPSRRRRSAMGTSLRAAKLDVALQYEFEVPPWHSDVQSLPALPQAHVVQAPRGQAQGMLRCSPSFFGTV